MVLSFLKSELFPLLVDQRRVIVAQASEIEQLRARNAELERTAEARRPAKGRSPAEWRFRILGWEWIDMVIYPRELPAGKTIRALRIFVPLEDQPDGPGYWDITRKKAIAMIEPLLELFAGTQTYLTLSQHGAGARSFDSLAVSHPRTP